MSSSEINCGQVPKDFSHVLLSDICSWLQEEDKAPAPVAVLAKKTGPFLAPIADPLADERLTKKLLKLAKKASKRKQTKRGVKEVVKAIRKKFKG